MFDPTPDQATPATPATPSGIAAYDLALRTYVDEFELLDEAAIITRGDVLRALARSPDRSSPQFWSHLDAYWSA